MSAPKTGPSSAFRLGVGGVVAILLLLPLGVWALVVAPRASRQARLDEATSAARADFALQRWERPVLRGAAIRGNAWDAQVELLRGIRPFDAELVAALGDRLRTGSDLEAVTREAEAQREGLLAYRSAAARSFAWVGFDPADQVGPPYLGHLRAARLLTVLGARSEPAECLAILADVIRLGQDRVAGGGLVPLVMVHVHVQEIVTPFARCLVAADPEARARAAAELAILARHPAPTGLAMEAETLFMAAMLSEQARSTPTIPLGGEALFQWMQLGALLEAWELRLGTPGEDRRIGAHYPEDFARVEAWERGLYASGNEVLRDSLPGYARFLRRDATARAGIAMLWAAARMLLELDAAPAGAPRLLGDAEMHDPLTGQAFSFVRDEDGVTLSCRGAEEGTDPEGLADDLEVFLPAAAWAPAVLAPTPSVTPSE